MKRFLITIFIILPFLSRAQEKEYLGNGLYIFNNNILDESGNIIHSPNGLNRFARDAEIGFENDEGQVLLSYDRKTTHLGYFFNDGLCEIKQKGKYGFINTHGQLIIPLKFKNVRLFSEGLCAVLKDGWGYINTLGKLAIPYKYQNAFEFWGGVAVVEENSLFGIIDKTGKEILPCKYSFIYQINEDLFFIGGKFPKSLKLISLSKGVLLDHLELFCTNMDKEYEYYNHCKPYLKFSLIKNYYCLEKNRKKGIIDNNGNILLPFIYDEIYTLDKKIKKVRKDNLYGFIDSNFNEVIPCIYWHAEDFKDGFSKVSNRNDLCGYINETGKVVLPIKYQCDASNLVYERDRYILKNYFPAYAKDYVSPRIEKWQQKGEFESSSEYTKRVNETNRKKLIEQYTEEARRQFWSEQKKGVINNFKLAGNYDADNQSFLFRSDTYGDFIIRVPKEDAIGFKYDNEFNLEQSRLDFIDTDYTIGFSKLVFTSYGKNFSWSSGSENKYATVKIDYNFSPIEIKPQEIIGVNTGLKPEFSTISVGKSDVDVNIPVTSNVNRKTFVVIFANESYQKEVKVPFAKNDGSTFREYCIKTLGIPSENIRYVADATLNNMRFEVNWLSDVLNTYRGEASAIFYYSGHGVPDESTRNAYLLPVDGFGSDPKTGYSLDDIFQKLGNAPSKSITYFVDACFSGAKKDGGMIKNMKAIEIEVVSSTVLGNAVLFSASKENQSAHIYEEKEHGLFTYFLLKKLQETQGAVDFTTLADYIKDNVERTSVVVKSKKQTPSVTPSHSIGITWQNWKLK